MGEMKVIGSKAMIEQAISEETKEFFNLDIQGGDTKLVFNPRDADEVAQAKATFDSLKEKRFMAFKVDSDSGDKGEQIDEFDAEAGKLILAPPMAGGC